MPSDYMQYIAEVCNRRQAQNHNLSMGMGKVLLTNSQCLAKLLLNQPIKALLIQHDRKKA